MSDVIPIVSESGVTLYKKAASRVPEFLEYYGPEQGYQIETEINDTLSLKPQLKELYLATIQAGKNPQEVGLPEIPGHVMIYWARLKKDGQTIAEAHAVRPVSQYKDSEKGETAALQRLMARLGFAGEVLESDEAEDMADQDLETGEAVPEQASESDTDEEEKGADAPPQASNKQLDLIYRQIEAHAKRRGVRPDYPDELKEAQQVLQKLIKGETGDFEQAS